MTPFTLYTNGCTRNVYNTSFCFKKNIVNKSDVYKACMEDVVMSEFSDGYNNKKNFIKKYRNKNNFISCNVLYGDVDNCDDLNGSSPFTMKDFYKLFREYEFVLATSKSHQKEKISKATGVGNIADRYHFYFPLGREVNDALELVMLLRKIHQYMGRIVMDPCCIDVARFFYGNPLGKFFWNEGKSIEELLKNINLVKSHKTKKRVHPKLDKPKHTELEYGEKRNLLKELRKLAAGGFYDQYSKWIHLGLALYSTGFEVNDFQYLSWKDQETQQLCRDKWSTFNDTSISISVLYNQIKDYERKKYLRTK